ncbi:MAG: FGGY family carbohydrate kinase [Planctomycetaceae bacterium]|nr:FGGY family carbohydrate kinase [Planctomycetaceae bacterium]
MEHYIIALDIGTQGTKCELFDSAMNVVAGAFETSRLISPKPGTVYQEADDMYGSCVRTIKEVVEKTNVRPESICAIGCDGQMAGIIGVDADGEAATYYDSWLDTRCGKYVDEMKTRAGKRILEITGSPVSYTHGPKILWWKHECPDVYRNVCKFVLPHNYVTGKMCGIRGDEAVFDSTCIHFSGFGDNLRKEWSGELLQLFEIDPCKMGRIVNPFDCIGKTTKAFAQECGLVGGIPVVAGAGDTSASTFGSGMFRKGVLLDCAGTSSSLCCVVDEYRPDTEHETMIQMPLPVDGLWAPLAYMNGAGLCIRWFRDEFTGTPNVSYDALAEEAEHIPPGSDGILFVPHFSGRVLPNNPHVKGSFIGLDWKHTRAHLYRAILEGIAYEYAYYHDVLQRLFPEMRFDHVDIVGGGANSSLFASIKSDVLGIPVRTLKQSEAALLGTAVIAACGVQLLDDYKPLLYQRSLEAKTFQPNEQRHRSYENYAREYLNLIRALEDIYRSDIYAL